MEKDIIAEYVLATLPRNLSAKILHYHKNNVWTEKQAMN